MIFRMKISNSPILSSHFQIEVFNFYIQVTFKNCNFLNSKLVNFKVLKTRGDY